MSDNRRSQLTIRECLFMIVGIAFSFWLFQPKFKQMPPSNSDGWLMLAMQVPLGVSLAGGPMLVWNRIRFGRRWRTGALFWFCIAVACWALAPAAVIGRIRDKTVDIGMICLTYVVPLMGLFLSTVSLIAGRPAKHWWRCRSHWLEWFGMWTVVAWAGIGLYVLVFCVYADSLK